MMIRIIKMMMIKSNADLTGAEMQGNEVDVANLSLRLQDLNTKEAELAGNLKQWREKNGQVVLLSFTKNILRCSVQYLNGVRTVQYKVRKGDGRGSDAA